MENTKQITLKNFRKDININSSVLKELFIDLSGAELQVLFHLICFINNDNVIVKNKNQQTLGITEFSKMITSKYDTSRTPDTYRKIISYLIKKDVIKKAKLSIPIYANKTVLILNPWISSHSSKHYFEILELFNNSKWKKVIDNNEFDRNSFEYVVWEETVKERDNFKCCICGDDLDIEVHHISPFSDDYENRINVDNGICLCKRHHSSKIIGGFHQTYGTRNNTPEQLLEYIKIKRKELGITDTSFIKSPLLLEHIEEI